MRWYVRHLDCEPVADRPDTADCGSAELTFMVQPTLGSTQGTGVNHISFSYPDLAAKMAELEAVGVRGSGVRLQRFPDGSTWRDVPGLYRLGYIFDPWGTRIQMVEDHDTLGFHHVQLSAEDPDATRAWYRDVLGGEPASLRGQMDALRFGDVWVLVSEHELGVPASTVGRAIDHIAFVVEDLDAAAAALAELDVVFEQEPSVPANARAQVQRAFIVAPDSVRLEVVETGWAGLETDRPAEVATADLEPYDVPRTPWGEPDLQGVWTGNSAHGIPLERPEELEDIESLTPEEAEARRERGTLGSIWGYEREWRDTTLGYVKTAPSRQVAMVVDPPDGRIPPLTAAAEARLANRVDTSGVGRIADGPEDLSLFVRCITRGLPGLMMPSIYNNGLQIVQGPGFVAIQKEMIHETRMIPTEPRPAPGPGLSSWLGIPQGRWEGDTLVVETTNFNGPGAVPRLHREPAADRALHPPRPDGARVPVHGRRPRDVDTAVDRHVPVRQGRRAVRAGRVRLPRGQLRHDQHPERRPGARAGGGRRPVESTSDRPAERIATLHERATCSFAVSPAGCAPTVHGGGGPGGGARAASKHLPVRSACGQGGRWRRRTTHTSTRRSTEPHRSRT